MELCDEKSAISNQPTPQNELSWLAWPRISQHRFLTIMIRLEAFIQAAGMQHSPIVGGQTAEPHYSVVFGNFPIQHRQLRNQETVQHRNLI